MGSLSIAAILYYRGNPFVAGELAVSTLQSPLKNPAGFLIASSGPFIGAALLGPLIPLFYGRFRSDAIVSTTIGAATLTISLVAFCVNAVLSLLSYTGRIHADLATLSFACAVVGILFLLKAGKNYYLSTNGERSLAMAVLLWINFLSLVTLFVLFVGPDYLGFTNPLKLLDIDPWHVIGISEFLYAVLAFVSLRLLISVAESDSAESVRE